MALDYSRYATPDNWFNGYDDGGNLVQYLADGQNGNRLLTQADIDAFHSQIDQRVANAHQGIINAGGIWNTSDPFSAAHPGEENSNRYARPSGVPDSWRLYAAEGGQGMYWGPADWEKPNHNDGFFQKDAYDPRAIISEMPGLPLLLAPLAGVGAGAAGDASLAGGGEVGSGYAASAPALSGAGGATGSGVVAGTSGAETLAGGSDTLGGSTMTNGYFDDFTGQWVDTPPADPNATGAFDQFGSMSNPTSAGTITFDGADAAFGNQVGADNSTIFGGTASDPFGTGSSSSLSLNDLKNALNAYKLLSGGGSANGGGLFGGGGGLFGGGGLGSTAARSAPGLMALAYAAGQPGIDTGQLNSILGTLGGNQDAVVRAATDPVNANIAAGYGDLVQSQALRGIRGSSFGDTDIGNYIATTGRTLANAGATAAEGSLALQGNLAGNIASLRAQSQKMKNDLYGRAFDVLGRGLNPGGYAGTTNVNVGGGATPTGGAPSSASPGIDWTKLIPLATSAFNFATG